MDIPGGSTDTGHLISVGSSKIAIFVSFARYISGVKIVCSYTLIVQLKFQNVQLNPTICAVNVSHEKI